MLVYLLTHQDEDLEYLVVSTKLFKKAVEKVVEMGFDPLKTNRLLSAVSVIMSLGESTWEKRVEFYEKWGWSKSQILQVFRTKPWFMMESEEEIDKVMDYLVNKMGFQTSLIAKNPGLLLSSMEKRIVPRCLVYQYCVDNGLMKDKMFCGFCWWLKCSQDIFVERLKRYETKAPGVLKFYQEKLDHARIKDGNLFQLSIW